MPHYKTLIERDYLGSWDLIDPKTDKPRDFTLTIAKVQTTRVYNKKVNRETGKATIWFKEARKGFIANITNLDIIAGMYGADYAKWVGNKITLFATTTPVGRETMSCIRVRSKKPTGPAEEKMPEREVDPEQRGQQDQAFGRDEEPAEPGSYDQ